ncbi:Photosystem I reaction center subunit III [Pleurocapsa sp. CCALA 161]|uniref:Photosystem I reaction center subunit III n=1 Tax=Pleurocapsa sp. CCALA 161 TaxID=2107688 RepID=UPI001E5A1C23|nr:Photosystem I reaction center subunit III [Pleurocapsa sp. CCALA 161]
MMKKLLPLILAIILWCAAAPTATADGILVRCKDSPAYQARVASYPDNYYFSEPDRAYGEYLTCGEDDGLPHLVIGFDRTIDIAIAFSIFFYITGFIGWSGRAYLRAISQKKSQEQLEILIDLPVAVQSLAQGLLWPMLAVKETLSGELTARNDEISVSPR